MKISGLVGGHPPAWYIFMFCMEVSRPIIAMIYPAVESIRAAEMVAGDESKQWLTYWVLYSLLVLAETYVIRSIVWLRFYGIVRFIAIAWLVSPQTRGAKYIYDRCVLPASNMIERRFGAKVMPDVHKQISEEEKETLHMLPTNVRMKLMEAIRKEGPDLVLMLKHPARQGEGTSKHSPAEGYAPAEETRERTEASADIGVLAESRIPLAHTQGAGETPPNIIRRH